MALVDVEAIDCVVLRALEGLARLVEAVRFREVWVGASKGVADRFDRLFWHLVWSSMRAENG